MAITTKPTTFDVIASVATADFYKRMVHIHLHYRGQLHVKGENIEWIAEIIGQLYLLAAKTGWPIQDIPHKMGCAYKLFPWEDLEVEELAEAVQWMRFINHMTDLVYDPSATFPIQAADIVTQCIVAAKESLLKHLDIEEADMKPLLHEAFTGVDDGTYIDALSDVSKDSVLYRISRCTDDGTPILVHLLDKLKETKIRRMI